MSKAILMNIPPKMCELIANGKNTIEMQKTTPELETPFKCYIYCTANGKTIFGNDTSYVTDNFNLLNEKAIQGFENTSGFYKWNGKVIGEFACNNVDSHAMNISNLTFYNKPKALSEFIQICPEWEKGKITNVCLKCKHYFTSNVECFSECDCEGELPVIKPSQSWLYVEALV